MDKELRKILKGINNLVSIIEREEIDISQEFPDEKGRAYELQDDLRLQTRSLSTEYYSIVTLQGRALGIKQNRKILNGLKRVKELFGDHPFHHVIDGRIAKIVKIELKKRGKIPPEYMDDYAYFKFHPWNSPYLNYNTPHDCIRCGTPEYIPPDWKPS